MTGYRVTIYLPTSLGERIEAVRDQINISRICAAALTAELERLKTPKHERKWLERLRLVREADVWP